jgi:hypothetical protein
MLCYQKVNPIPAMCVYTDLYMIGIWGHILIKITADVWAFDFKHCQPPPEVGGGDNCLKNTA